MDVSTFAQTVAGIGALMRLRRRELGLTQGAVAERAGLSVGFISQIERGLTMPSLSSMVAIAGALETTAAEFLRQPRTPPMVTYRDSRDSVTISENVANRYDYERLSTVFPGSTLHSVLFHIPPGYSAETVAHQGEELVYIVKGSMRIQIGEEHFVLNEGDSAHFNSDTPHRYESNSDETTVIVYVGTLGLFS